MLRPLAVLCVLTVARPALAEDWPQWMGPKRDNVWREDGILEKFPKDGPKILWRTPIAGGYGGPAVAGGRVFVADYVTKEDVKVDNFDLNEFSGTERFLALDAAKGTVLWKHESPVKYRISYPSGPRCTPTIDGDRVYFLGAEGHLVCRKVDTGDLVWEMEIKKEYKSRTPMWGFAAHPLVDGKKLVILAGGDGAHTVALDKLTGKELWRSGSSAEMGYSPPSIIEAGGKRQLIVFRPNAVVSLDPETGKPYWSIPYTASSGQSIMTPVVSGDLMFAGGYQDKNILIKLAKDEPKAEMVWKDKKRSAIGPVGVQPIAFEGTLYGYDDSGDMYAVEFATGKRLWEGHGPLPDATTPSASAFLVRQGDRFWMFAETGHLVIAKLTPKGYEEIDRAKVLEPTNKAFGRKVVWCSPAYADKRCFVRNDKEIICVDLAK